MDSLKFKQERATIIENMEALVSQAKEEKRDLTEEETNEFDAFDSTIKDLDKKIERSERMEKLNASIVSKSTSSVSKETPKEIRDYSFQEAMKQAYSGRMEGLVKEMDQEARNEARYTGQSFKGIAIPSSVLTTRAAVATSAGNATEVMSWTDQLENNLVLASAGANFYGGVNNMKFPVFSSINSGFVAETGGSAPAANGTASSITLSPKKLISIVNVSAEAMAQNSGLEAALRRNMAANIASTLESALLQSDGDVSNGPESIFRDAATGPTTDFTAAAAVSMEQTLIANGVQLQGARMAYLMDSDAYAAAKTAVQVTGVSALYDNSDKTVNSYFSFVSGNVASDGTADKAHVLFGDFSKCHIAQFGGLDILFDPYTNAGTGEARMVVTSLVDGNAVQNDTAFVQLSEA
jgi:HK97 family phage major capsid protein